MIGAFFSRMRYAVAPWLAAVVLLISACESLRQPDAIQDDKIKTAKAPVKEAAPALPAKPSPGAVQPQARHDPFPPRLPLPQQKSTPPQSPYLDKFPGGGAKPQALTSETTRVALLLPLSGPNASLGQDMLNAAQLAMFAFADSHFELLLHDTRGSTEGAIDAMSQAIGDGAQLILGPLHRASVRAVAPAARAANVPVIAFSSDKSVAGQGVFAMGFHPEAEIERVLAFARSRGIARFAVLAPDDEGGKKAVEALQKASDANGATVSRIQYYNPNSKDFSGVVRRLANYDERHKALQDQKAKLEEKGDEISKRALERLDKLQTLGDLPFDALLLADGGKRLQAIAALLPFYDIDPEKTQILGTGRWDDPETGAEPALAGGWFAAPPPEAREEFERQYQDAYGKKPERLATLAYDAMALAAVLAQAKGGADFSPSAVTAASGFMGRDGIFRFLDDGSTERGLAVLKVLRRGYKVLDKAPVTFEAPTN